MSKTINTNKKAKKSVRLWLPWVIILIAFAGLVIFSLLPSKEKPLSGPRFQKEGTLQFIGSQEQIIQTIDIEIADNEFDQAQGLMWRKSMEEHQGMLFVMDKMEEQSFWMLNTYIALDIIFLDAHLKIVKIKANAQPQSLDAIKSERPAQYVLEVNAGYCEKYNIKEGDKIQFKRK
ncbi:MAG: DUF192 domain-containing protein [Saprospiraceae bacterium]|nr:DUF192 domain-containing protein [Saprospiraceae bacterium]